MNERNPDPSIIRDARRLITPKGAWTQKAEARANDGFPVEPDSRAASCWCPEGAIRALGGGSIEMDALADYVGAPGVWFWNDNPGRTQAEVLAAMDGCADAAELRRIAL